MKKIFSLFAAMLFAGSMMATSITLTGESGFLSTYSSDKTFTVDDVEFWCSAGVCYNGKGTPEASAAKSFIQLRKSDKGAGEIKNNTELSLKSITIATQNDKDFTLSAGTKSDDLSAVDKPEGTSGKYSFTDKNGSAAECDVTIYTFNVNGKKFFDILNGAAASYFAYITIELAEGGEGGEGGEEETIDNPVIAGNVNFQEEVTVTLSCETEDAEIHYTLDGSDPDAESPLYEDALTLTATTTVKAIAIKDELVSEIVEKTFTLFPTEFTCADAAEAALSVSDNNVLYANGLEFSVTGYVTEIAYAWANGTMSFWMADAEDGGKVLEAYKCAIANAEDAPGVGDLVTVSGKLTKFNTTPEFATGCTCEIIEKHSTPAINLGAKSIAEFLELKNEKDTCVLTGIVDNIVMDKDDATQYNMYGNFDLVDENDPEVKVYIYGLLTADGQSKKFREMNIDEGDILTVKAVYTEFQGNPQAKNAIFVKVVKNETTGISNVAVETKAQKVIRDGQLYIVKDGVLFNANGVAVK